MDETQFKKKRNSDTWQWFWLGQLGRPYGNKVCLFELPVQSRACSVIGGGARSARLTLQQPPNNARMVNEHSVPHPQPYISLGKSCVLPHCFHTCLRRRGFRGAVQSTGLFLILTALYVAFGHVSSRSFTPLLQGELTCHSLASIFRPLRNPNSSSTSNH